MSNYDDVPLQHEITIPNFCHTISLVSPLFQYDSKEISRSQMRHITEHSIIGEKIFAKHWGEGGGGGWQRM